MGQTDSTSEALLYVYNLRDLEGVYIEAGHSNFNDDVLFVHYETGERFAIDEYRKVTCVNVLFEDDVEDLPWNVQDEIKLCKEWGESCSWNWLGEYCDLDRVESSEFCAGHLEKVMT